MLPVQRSHSYEPLKQGDNLSPGATLPLIGRSKNLGLTRRLSQCGRSSPAPIDNDFLCEHALVPTLGTLKRPKNSPHLFGGFWGRKTGSPIRRAGVLHPSSGKSPLAPKFPQYRCLKHSPGNPPSSYPPLSAPNSPK